MKLTAERLRLVSVLALAALSMVRQAEACSCGAWSWAVGGFKEAAAVFEGEVTSIESRMLDHKGEQFVGALRVRFKVHRVWKGAHSPDAVVETSPDESMCGYSFRRGVAYVVYAYPSDTPGNPPFTLLCSRTKGGAARFYERVLLGPAEWTP